LQPVQGKIIMSQKIIPREELVQIVQARQAQGEKCAFTNGCFDLLHIGHLRSLQGARAQGDFLVVGLNTDDSVRRLKGPARPIIPQEERAEMLAGLECVDYVCLFDEDTAEALVEALRPEVYVKSGEYRDKPLPERHIVEAYGGKVVLLPLVHGHSTTKIVERILQFSDAGYLPGANPPLSLDAVFLDRDGVINVLRRDHVKHPDELQLLPGAAEAVARLNQGQVPVIIITNQSGLGRGLYPPETLACIHAKLRSELARAGAKLTAIYHCPHRPDEGCACRKPRPTLLHWAAYDFGLDLTRTVFVGDSRSDIEAGTAAGCRTVLVRTGYGAEEAEGAAQWPIPPDFIAADLKEAVDWIYTHF